MSPAQLSQVLSGKRPLTAKAAFRIAQSLSFSPLETSAFVESTLLASERVELGASSEIAEEEFQLIADWYHFAILSLSELPHHKADPRWIAGQLGISTGEAATAVARLERLRIIEVSRGKMKQVMNPIRTTTDVPSAAIRRYHRQNLEKAKDKLEEVALGEREYSAITMALSRKNLPKAKKMLTDFKRKLSALLEKGEKQAVYTLAFQLFPVSKLEDRP